MNRKDNKRKNFINDKIKDSASDVKNNYTGMIYAIVPVLVISIIILVCVSHFRNLDDNKVENDIKPALEEVTKEPQVSSTPKPTVSSKD